ncbi:MAG TPA: hypothetical protein VLH09_03985 [Bryobacteraceae bacterium]|nr:hypothetical protein [Bryobacteraceae bacterium]
MELTTERAVDSLDRLEERIVKAAQVVAELRRERDAATEIASKLKQELETLRAERQEVRARIERLLGQVDLLGGG